MVIKEFPPQLEAPQMSRILSLLEASYFKLELKWNLTGLHTNSCVLCEIVFVPSIIVQNLTLFRIDKNKMLQKEKSRTTIMTSSLFTGTNKLIVKY